MLVLADELLENFFDHEFAASFKLTEKPVEKQRSLGREIFDSLFATGVRFANSRAKPQVHSPSSSRASIVSSPTNSSVPSVTAIPILTQTTTENSAEPLLHNEEEEPQDVTEKKEDESEEEKEEDGDDNFDDDDDEEGGDVLEEVDRLLKEYGEDEDEKTN